MIISSIRNGMIGGMVFTLLMIPWSDFERSVVLGATGTIVSFFVSLLLRKLTRKWKP